MSDKFKIEIISPEKTILEADIEEAIIPAFEGMMTILKDHISLVTFLRPGFIEITETNKFKKLREDSYLTNCPCHDDNNPSLAISQGHSRVIFKCFAGCSQQELLNYFSNELRQS